MPSVLLQNASYPHSVDALHGSAMKRPYCGVAALRLASACRTDFASKQMASIERTIAIVQNMKNQMMFSNFQQSFRKHQFLDGISSLELLGLVEKIFMGVGLIRDARELTGDWMLISSRDSFEILRVKGATEPRDARERPDFGTYLLAL